MFKVLLLLSIFLVTALAAPASEPDDAQENGLIDDGTWRVVGGNNSGPTDAPYMVSLRTNGNWHICAATLINARTAVTAGHCVNGVPVRMINVVMGSLLLHSGGQWYDALRTLVHPNFNNRSLYNDIALVITQQSVQFSPTVQPIGLSLQPTGAGVSVLLTGWGQTSFPGIMAPLLQKITLKTLDIDDCKTRLKGVGSVNSSQICAFTKVGQGACHGDSGGPLVSDTGLVGVVSWGAPCAKGFPDVYSRISYFSTWIIQNSQIPEQPNF